MQITTLFNINDAVYYHDKDGSIRGGTVNAIDIRVFSDDTGGGTMVERPTQISYKVYVNDGNSVPTIVNKFEADLTGTAPPPQG